MKILETVLYAENLAECRDFYADVLGLEVISFDPDRDLFLKLDGSVLILFKPSKTVIHDAGVPPHGTVGIGHLAFQCGIDEIDAVRDGLKAKGVPIIQEITWRNGARSFYFTDPAGNVLEFATPNLWL